MPKKTIREMSERERRHYSLETKTFRAVLMSSLILGIVSLIVGVGLYAYSLGNHFIDQAFGVTKNASTIIGNALDITSTCVQTTTIYNSIPEEERQVQDDAYFARFSEVTETQEYSTAMRLLRDFKDNDDISDIFIAMYDEEYCRLVYIADPDEARPCPTGTWEEETESEVRKFLNWDGKGSLYNISYTDKYGWLCTCGVPVIARDGSVVAFIMADVSLVEILNGMKIFVLQYSIATVLTVFFLGYLLTRHIRRNMVVPINSIAVAAETYARDKRDKDATETDHFSGLDVSTGDEIENLWFILSDMEKDLNAYEEEHTRAVQEQERIGTELNLATRIQADMLPNVFPPFPERKDFDIYGAMIPAKAVGGDFYDYFLVDDDHLCVVMADVSGKGVPAALFMMASKILLKTRAMMGESPAVILEKVNDQICSNNSQEMFVTVWIGILELSTGRLTAANAGHEYPVIKHGDGFYELLKDKHGFVVGGLENMKYKEYEICLEPGSEVFLYTDGVTEATNSSTELFGTERLLRSLNSGEGGTPEKVLKKIKKAVNSFARDTPQFDDITMLCLSYKGPVSEADEAERKDIYMKELNIEATVNNIPTVTEFVNAELESLDCPVKAQMQIDIAIDELFGNIAQYAYDPETGPATVRVEVEEEPMAVIITFIDHGKPYDPLKGADPDVSLSAEERSIGGLGIFLVKKTMDEITYEYKDGHNILKIRKNM